MNEIDIFKEKAIADNLCGEFTHYWSACRNRKQYIDLMLGSKGLDYVCDAINKGWGIPTSYIKDNFEPYINGKYISEQKGYDSELYCEYSGDILARTTNLAILSSDVTIDVPQGKVTNIYATNGSKIRLEGKGSVILIKYGELDFVNESECKVKIIDKKDRDDGN